MNTAKIIKKTTGSLWIYYRDEPSDPLSTNPESFKYKTSIVGNIYNVDLTVIGDGGNPVPNPNYDANKAGTKETEVVIPLKHLELILTWTKNCALADMTVRAAGNNNDPAAVVAPTGLEFQITDTKLYVPVVTLSEENNSKASRTIKDRI